MKSGALAIQLHLKNHPVININGKGKLNEEVDVKLIQSEGSVKKGTYKFTRAMLVHT